MPTENLPQPFPVCSGLPHFVSAQQCQSKLSPVPNPPLPPAQGRVVTLLSPPPMADLNRLQLREEEESAYGMPPYRHAPRPEIKSGRCHGALKQAASVLALRNPAWQFRSLIVHVKGEPSLRYTFQLPKGSTHNTFYWIPLTGDLAHPAIHAHTHILSPSIRATQLTKKEQGYT